MRFTMYAPGRGPVRHRNFGPNRRTRAAAAAATASLVADWHQFDQDQPSDFRGGQKTAAPKSARRRECWPQAPQDQATSWPRPCGDRCGFQTVAIDYCFLAWVRSRPPRRRSALHREARAVSAPASSSTQSITNCASRRATQRKGPNLAAQPAVRRLARHLRRQPATRNVAVKPLGNAAFGLFGGIAVLFQQRDRQARIETGARQTGPSAIAHKNRQIGPDPAATNDTDALQVFGRRRTNRPDCRALG